MQNSYKYEIYRKLIHLSSLWMVFAIYFLDKKLSLTIFLTLTILIFGVETLRKNSSLLEKTYQSLFGKVLRNHEQEGAFSGAFFVLCAAFLSTLFFSKNIAAASLSVMLISDSAAALVGKKLGRYKFFDKTIEGSAAFFVSAILVLLIFYDYLIPIIATAFLATITELFAKKIKVDDNLTITLATSISLFILT